MAGFWRMHCHGRKTWYCHKQNKDVVYLHFFSYPWLPNNNIYGDGILDEYEEIYFKRKAQPDSLPIKKGIFF